MLGSLFVPCATPYPDVSACSFRIIDFVEMGYTWSYNSKQVSGRTDHVVKRAFISIHNELEIVTL